MESAENYLNQLDLDAVARAIENIPEGAKPLPEFDYEDARSMVWRAAEKWLPKDLESLTLLGVEESFEFSVIGPRFRQGVHGYYDLRGSTKDPEFDSVVGIIVDWKTSRNTLDGLWRSRLIDSFQWRIYARASGSVLVAYRGLNRKGEVKELILRVPESNTQEVEEQVIGLGSMRAALVDQELPVWPRNSPNACFAYNEQCPYYADCQGNSMPRVRLDHAPLSYSQMNSLMLCPERTRRGIIADREGKPEESLFGNAVHRGLAELWRQAFTKFKGFNGNEEINF